MTPAVVLLILRLVVALALYAFLGALTLYLLKDFRAAIGPRAYAPEAHLEMIAGPNPGAVFSLVEVNLLGRSADCTIRVADKTMSAHHGRLSFHASQWWMEDLGSRNGSSVNEVRVTEPIVVTYGDRLGLGRVVFRLQSGRPPSVPQPELNTRPRSGDDAESPNE
jgi:pSer/pThr/pTyr-binding forkhead associated (FHA) protein